MQLIHFEQQRIFTNESTNEQWQQALALEKAQDEIALLREQIDSLQQYFSERLQQQQAIEQERDQANQELELMNTEIQLMVEVKRLFFEEAKEFMKMLPDNGEINREKLLKLFRKFHNKMYFSEEP